MTSRDPTSGRATGRQAALPCFPPSANTGGLGLIHGYRPAGLHSLIIAGGLGLSLGCNESRSNRRGEEHAYNQGPRANSGKEFWPRTSLALKETGTRCGGLIPQFVAIVVAPGIAF